MIKKNSKPNPLPIKKEEFEIPESFFSQLKEFTGGGFILMTIDKDGFPQVYPNYDNLAMCMALESFGADYFNAARQTQSEFVRECRESNFHSEEDGEMV